MKSIFWGLGIMAAIALLALALTLTRDSKEPAIGSELIAQAAPVSIEGFSRAEAARPIDFTADQGPHPDFQTEWWYFTGNLDTDDGRHFGYQLTFFRRALLPPDQIETRDSDWGAVQVYMAHFTLSDVANQQHYFYERLERGAADLAGAEGSPFMVWLGDWRVEQTQPGHYTLRAAEGEISLELSLVDQKGPVLQGKQGYSQKGPEPGNASYYVSLTRLDTAGSIQIDGKRYQVKGLSWMDHEWSTSALSADQVGWDWFSIQLDDGSELMVFQIRKADGSIVPFSAGTWIAPDGTTIELVKDDFQIEVLDTWKSPESGADYPARWRLKVPKVALEFEIKPYLADQELNVSYDYWEGAVSVKGSREGQVVQGSGYVELTGYAGSMGGEF
jgi:predicted secreted hydrolase